MPADLDTADRSETGINIVCLLMGGPEYDIQVNGNRYHFEMHPYCGPTVLNNRGDPAAKQPMEFLEAASLWAQQGQRAEDGLCRWDREPKEILEHLGGRNYRVLGYEPAVRGE